MSLYIKLLKYIFYIEEVNFLNYIISINSIYINKVYIKTIFN